MADLPSNSVFISYRRDAAGYLALALYQKLKDQEIDAFYDIENIRAGQFEPIILNQIAARPYFLLLLTPDTLERCVEEEDWVRREIVQAIATHRVLVPTYTPTFDFDDIERYLPGDLGPEVRRFNAQELPHNLKWFEAAVKQLVEEFLVPVQVEQATVSASSQAVVDRAIQKIDTLPAVTDAGLSAQQHFERARRRRARDKSGKIDDYSEAIRLDPKMTEAFNYRGLERWKRKDLDEAISDFDEAIRTNPQFPTAYSNRGVVRMKRGDFDGAMADFQEAILLNPQLGIAYSNRAALRQRRGDHDGAIADFKEAIRLGFGPAHVALLDARFRRLFRIHRREDRAK